MIPAAQFACEIASEITKALGTLDKPCFTVEILVDGDIAVCTFSINGEPVKGISHDSKPMERPDFVDPVLWDQMQAGD